MISQQKLLIICNRNIKTKHNEFTLRFRILAWQSNKVGRDFAKFFVDEKTIQITYRTFLPMPDTSRCINHFLYAAICSNWLDWSMCICSLNHYDKATEYYFNLHFPLEGTEPQRGHVTSKYTQHISDKFIFGIPEFPSTRSRVTHIFQSKTKEWNRLK